MKNKTILLVWLILCHFGNIADMVLTFYAISRGAEEANPLMAYLLNISPLLFASAKILIFSLAIDLVARKHPVFLKPIGIFYLLVLGWHSSFVFIL